MRFLICWELSSEGKFSEGGLGMDTIDAASIAAATVLGGSGDDTFTFEILFLLIVPIPIFWQQRWQRHPDLSSRDEFIQFAGDRFCDGFRWGNEYHFSGERDYRHRSDHGRLQRQYGLYAGLYISRI